MRLQPPSCLAQKLGQAHPGVVRSFRAAAGVPESRSPGRGNKGGQRRLGTWEKAVDELLDRVRRASAAGGCGGGLAQQPRQTAVHQVVEPDQEDWSQFWSGGRASQWCPSVRSDGGDADRCVAVCTEQLECGGDQTAVLGRRTVHEVDVPLSAS
jgi:hypothetical protein